MVVNPMQQRIGFHREEHGIVRVCVCVCVSVCHTPESLLSGVYACERCLSFARSIRSAGALAPKQHCNVVWWWEGVQQHPMVRWLGEKSACEKRKKTAAAIHFTD